MLNLPECLMLTDAVRSGMVEHLKVVKNEIYIHSTRRRPRSSDAGNHTFTPFAWTGAYLDKSDGGEKSSEKDSCLF